MKLMNNSGSVVLMLNFHEAVFIGERDTELTILYKWVTGRQS